MHDLAPDGWRRLFALLDDALDLPPHERARWLEGLEGSQADLLPSLRELLDRHARGELDGLLPELPTYTESPESLSSAGDDAIAAGDRVGPYTLVRELGRGGMAVVWLAERADGAFRRTVALKLPRAAWSGGWRERLAREREILAGLEHPNIARLYDAGVDDLGRPFMAMEHVEGVAIDAYCRRRDLAVEDRLQLVLEVAKGVSYAHSRLVVHRDLKPGNVLVSADGSVHLLDFGIAKLLARDPLDEARLTQATDRVLTPAYAAPEQIRGETVGTATDVYSLGVMTYELLTGALPYRLARTSIAELEEAIATADPRAASDAAADETVRRRLRGDLDAILGKALKKDPAERYPTVDAFARDLKRHLDGQPVEARPDTRTYRLRRFASRHRGSLLAAGGVALLLLAATALSLWQAHVAAAERNRALRLLARNQAMNEFVSAMLTEVASPDASVTLDSLLQRSEALVFGGTTSEPEHQAVILQMLSSYYGALGDRGRTEALLARALTLARGGDDTVLAGTLECQHAQAEAELGRVDEARRTIDSVLARDARPAVAAPCLRRRALIARDTNDAPGALEFARRAQAALAGLQPPDPIFEAGLLGDLAYASHLNGRTAEAERLFAESIGRFEALGRAEHHDANEVRSNWSLLRFQAGDVLGSLALADDCLAIARRHAAGGEPPLSLLADHAMTLDALARYPDAMAELAHVLEVARARRDAGAATFVLVALAKVQLGLGDPDRAEATLDEALAAEKGAVPADSVGGVNAEVVRARIAAARGRLDDADERFSRLVAFWDARKVVTGATWAALRDRAEVRLRQGRLDEALADARRAEGIARSAQGDRPFSSMTGISLSQVARIDARAGRTEEASRAAREALPHLERSLGASHPETVRARAEAGS